MAELGNVSTENDEVPHISSCHDELLNRLSAGGRLMCVGPSGVGKSTWIASLVEDITQPIRVICADPGRPMKGPPGAVTLLNGELEVQLIEGLASMDCARYRSPLCSKVIQLLRQSDPELPLILDAPGITRGAGAEELLVGLAQAIDATTIVAFLGKKGREPYIDALSLRGFDVICVMPDARAKRLSDSKRQAARDDAWRSFLGDASSKTMRWCNIQWLGLMPAGPFASVGQQVVLCSPHGTSLGMGYVTSASGASITLSFRAWGDVSSCTILCARDARVDEKNALRTARAAQAPTKPPIKDEPDGPFALRKKNKLRVHLSSGPLIQGANIRTTFVGDLFEDPMVLLRLDHRQRCLSFDLGEVQKVPTRIIHQTSDVFMSHAHLDHIGDLSWMLRRLIGITTPVRLWGPKDIITRVHHGVLAYTWDRIGDRGPRFDIYEWDGGATMRRALVQAGVDEIQWLPDEAVQGNCLLKEPRIQVNAAVLDHGGTPVLAYAVEESKVYAVRGNVIRERGWQAGHWLGKLKTLAATGQLQQEIEVAHLDGTISTHIAQALHDLLLIPRPGQKIVYATDFADSPENREAVIALAHKAHIFICEAGFIMSDLEQAQRTGHMTTHGCGEIAHAADVQVLVPFHHSMRYEEEPELVYREVLSRFPRTYVPQPLLERLGVEKPNDT